MHMSNGTFENSIIVVDKAYYSLPTEDEMIVRFPIFQYSNFSIFPFVEIRFLVCFGIFLQPIALCTHEALLSTLVR